jgi:regulator of G-protein signaling
MRRLGVEDRAEASTIASVICKWGYIFPVENNYTPFKDDSTWMRFQSNLFWPSQNWDPDNTDYAIFLAKRLMRGKAKHALFDYEAEAYEQLHHVLREKWEQILDQARGQLSQLRSYKRREKQTFDSQERAFWRVHRPVPGSVKATEISKLKLAVMIRELPQGRLFPQGQEKIEISYYQSVLIRSSVRAQRECESLITYSQSYACYDSCFNAPVPGNPWITDDLELWTQACVRLDCVGKQRASKWGFNFSELLGDDTGQHAFSQFLEKEFSTENLNFWRECQGFKGLPASQIPAAADKIFRDFLALDSPSSINIDGPTWDAIKEALKKPTRYMFDAAETHIYELMKKGPYKRYLQSEEYKQLLQKNPVPSKKG